MDGRHGPAREPLPSIDQVPIPAVLFTLPCLHEDRPRGSTAMIDAQGAKLRLSNCRPGAWVKSPITGWRWAKWWAGFQPMLHYQNRFMSDQAMISSSLAKEHRKMARGIQFQIASPCGSQNRPTHSKCRPETVTAPRLPSPRPRNDAQKRIHWCGRCSDICACNYSGHRSDANARLAITVLEPVGCFYHLLEGDLRAGRSMSTVIDGKIIFVAEARRMVAYARVQGWLLPKPLKTMLPWT